MTDFAVPNARPGECAKCRGTGKYQWHATIKGRAVVKEGDCYSCQGTGRQDRADIKRNKAYNRYKLSTIPAGDLR